MSTPHTPEPWANSRHRKSPNFGTPTAWAYVQHHFPDAPYEGDLSDEWGIYPPLGESGPVALVAGKDNAERIVACVNACAGLSDPEATITALREALKGLVNATERADNPCDEGLDSDCPEMMAARAALKLAGER